MSSEFYFERCFHLAQLGLGAVSPNPLVGAVLVHADRIIGEGCHRRYGGAHAEVECLNDVSSEDTHLIPASTMYVSLEPCNHHGKTPPCTDAIIQSGIKKVFIGLKDPNPKVSGTGIAKLKEAGIQTIMCPNADDFLHQNAPFLTTQLCERPYIILKWAQSKDGYINRKEGRSKISDPSTDVIVHKWRSEVDGLLVGTNTVINDNPKLTTRLIEGKSPLRIVIDRNLRISPKSEMYTDNLPTLTYSLSSKPSKSNKIFSEIKGQEDTELDSIVKDLWNNQNIQTVMIEGGAKVLNAFKKAGLWDEARVITSGQIFEDGIKAPFVIGSRIRQVDTGIDRIEFICNPDSVKRLEAFGSN